MKQEELRQSKSKRIKSKRIKPKRIKLKNAMLLLVVLMTVVFGSYTGCGRVQSAASNSRMSTNRSINDGSSNTELAAAGDAILETSASASQDSSRITKNNSTYECDIAVDQLAFADKLSGNPDITVGDHYYATQINDWYTNFSQYEGKVVTIEGFYIGDYAPYDFIGRRGPTCPYCQGGYVCFEILTNEDVKQFVSGEDWIKATGVLRKGQDGDGTTFCYIEVLKLEKMDRVGVATVTN